MAQQALIAFKSHDAAGVSFVNTLAVRKDVPAGPDTDVTAQQFADDCWTWLGTEYRAMLAPDYTVDELHVLGILGGTIEGTHSVGLAGNLSLSGTTLKKLPKECTLVLTLKTAEAGRRGRGRMFIPSPLWADFMADTYSWNTGSAYWTNVGAFGTKILAGQDVTHGTLVHHYAGRLWSRVDGSTKDLTAYVRRAPVHWLRSRSTAP